jgi:hypothetical protein
MGCDFYDLCFLCGDDLREFCVVPGYLEHTPSHLGLEDNRKCI